MNLEDFTVRGGKPVMVFSSNIDVKGINDENWHLCEAVQAGMGDLLKKNQLVLLTGETAVMPHNITAFCDTNSPDQLIMTWSATVLGLAADGKPKNGSTVTPNMTIIGFCEDGYRCNGGTKITNLILDTWGEDFRKHSEAMDFIKMAAIPSQVYGQFIAEMNGWKEDGLYVPDDVLLAGAAHITGGGIWGKLPEALPEGVGAHLYDLPQPNPLLLKAQQLSLDTESTLSDYQCYRTFNGGFGMILIVQNHHAASVMEQASQAGIKAVKIGKTIQSDKNQIIIESAFHFGGQLSSLDPR
jgi:phosphoribosylformylglycinamidine cyclo-ligase